jgi:hypothetical protein
VTHELTEAELDDIERRATKAFEAAPLPWEAWLETRYATGGCSFVRFGAGPDDDNEMYVDVHLDGQQLSSPDPRLDAIVDFLGCAAKDVPRLVTEVRRLRRKPG